jgi:hypothetical protein
MHMHMHMRMHMRMRCNMRHAHAHAVHVKCAVPCTVRCTLRTHSGISLPSPSSLGSSSLEGAASASAVDALPPLPCAASVVSAPACQRASSPSAAIPPRVCPPTPAPSSTSPPSLIGASGEPSRVGCERPAAPAEGVSCVPGASGGMMAATGGGAAPRCRPRRSASLTAMPSSRSSLGTYVMSRKRSPGVSQTWLGLGLGLGLG